MEEITTTHKTSDDQVVVLSEKKKSIPESSILYLYSMLQSIQFEKGKTGGCQEDRLGEG